MQEEALRIGRAGTALDQEEAADLDLKTATGVRIVDASAVAKRESATCPVTGRSAPDVSCS